MPKLFIYGFPGLFGGANTELHHQINLWSKMGIDMTIIPMDGGYKNEPLYDRCLNEYGCKISEPNEFDLITEEDAIINFCSGEFLNNLPLIRQFTKRTIFVNCMTFLFDKEKEAHSKGEIALSLYQRKGILASHSRELVEDFNSKSSYMTFTPYFIREDFPYCAEYKRETCNMGRISRNDPDKYSSSILHIYEYAVAPRPKRGIFLGFDEKIQKKLGKTPGWIETYKDHHEFSVDRFYRDVDIVVQPTVTTENLPRVGFEAMYSGKPLVVDNRGGWKHLVRHGETGFLCNNEREFIYYSSKLMFEPELRVKMALAAESWACELTGLTKSQASWWLIFDHIFNINCK